MSLLYLIRHPQTQINLAIPAANWQLSQEGLRQTAALLEAPFWRAVHTVYPSRELKAVAAAKEAALRYNIPVIPRSAFGELNRSAYMAPDQEAFEAAAATCFAHPMESVRGWETGAAALARFQQEIEQVLSWHDAGQAVAVVSHGLVLTFYTAGLQGRPPDLDIWRAIPFGGVAAVDRATMRLLTPFVAAPYDSLPLPGDMRH